jgi:hypothetical protein
MRTTKESNSGLRGFRCLLTAVYYAHSRRADILTEHLCGALKLRSDH